MDSKSAIGLVQNPAHHKRSKHFRIKYHWIREQVEGRVVKLIIIIIIILLLLLLLLLLFSNVTRLSRPASSIKLNHIPTADIRADLMTKGLTEKLYRQYAKAVVW